MKSGNIFQRSNPMQSSKPSAQKPRFKVSDNMFEQFKSIGSGVGQSFKQDLVGGAGSTAMNSLFNPNRVRPNENRPSPEFPSFMRKPEQKIEKPREVFVFTKEDLEVKKRIEEIRGQLRMMIEALQKVDVGLQKAVESPISETGIYYVNFLDRIKEVLEALQKELSSAGTWNTMSQSRKKHKGYWAQYKKKGTQFGLSNELKMTHQTG